MNAKSWSSFQNSHSTETRAALIGRLHPCCSGESWLPPNGTSRRVRIGCAGSPYMLKTGAVPGSGFGRWSQQMGSNRVRWASVYAEDWCCAWLGIWAMETLLQLDEQAAVFQRERVAPPALNRPIHAHPVWPRSGGLEHEHACARYQIASAP